jgi:hypothetical protein
MPRRTAVSMRHRSPVVSSTSGASHGAQTIVHPSVWALTVGYDVLMASAVTKDQWRKTSLATMANYVDAGSIVAGAVSLPLWAKQFGFGGSFVSLFGAMSSNAISAGIGALIGGR